MLIWFVIIYWVISVGIGLWAALRVRNTADFAVAGRGLPFYVVTATVFATWFGSETVLGIPAVFLKEGLHGVVADPFGSSLCLILVGLFFARPLYRMNLLTIGDFYRNRFGRVAEVLTTLCIVVSYLGWVAAQIKALGLVFYTVSDGALSQQAGMMIGAASVLVYTLFGGMWSVAVTDFIQMIIIVIGMMYIGWEVSGQAGGVATVMAHASAAGKFSFWPAFNPIEVIGFVTAWITMMLGSIPQQDVFQRVTSSRTERIAGTASVLGGVLYFLFAFIPMFLAYSATLIDPQMVAKYINTDSQLILPKLVLEHAPLVAQVMFFGALLSAIKSCASATLLAPSVTFAENVLRPMLPRMDDKRFLRVMQAVVLVFTALVTVFALNSHLSIFHMVENAYKVTLVAAFVPLAFGLFWKRATRQGGLLAIVLGLTVWIWCEVFFPEAMLPPQLVGLLASLGAMVVGSLGPQWIRDRVPAREPVTQA
ncbi:MULTISPECIES: sodium:solute symporter family protein [Ralstonia solanacearum species complex]|uniref:sodium:solute symporter family protein n=1 Tax=Ralstonia solanacearum species complex TaxID=3116862 RepID=UPI00078C09E8|nr:sodium:solute symporter family protein [Ralstonia solanacearum]BEU73188.1 sodium:solute symporter family protein [Ralstonia pseudosolanacearum]AMP38593.1 sodium:solute symporter [Ralstonia solanacearum]AXV77994.1 sodium:solute symporter [Ralstonia solanacearum]AXV87420.1 sodium:solute symporter [Ralstonia solanacearum]AXV92020.1 sodium:solute symporter [Ralstonia solanacearum]